MPLPQRSLLVAATALCCVVGACGGQPATPAAPPVVQEAAERAKSSSASASTAASPTPSATPASPATASRVSDGDLLLAFAGDANAFKAAGDSTRLGLGDAGRLLAAADWSMVNLETALADDESGLSKQPKLYTFLTGRAFPEMLQREGIDVVSLANNHAMDYGVEGMERTLAIRDASTLPMVGVGRTRQEAFSPWKGAVRGRPVVALAGNDILESNMDWRPRDGRPGVAMVQTEEGFDALVEAVRAAREDDPEGVVVVFMHWGIDYQVCTTRRQESMAERLASAGATIVVGTHAHRVQRAETIGSTLVAYSLGNFNFYSDRVSTRETGVLTVRVPTSGTPSAEWAPGRIVGGRPEMLTGAEAAEARTRWTTLPGGC